MNKVWIGSIGRALERNASNVWGSLGHHLLAISSLVEIVKKDISALP